MAKINISFFVLFLFAYSLLFAAETLTISTYYPSPYGIYNQLTTTGNTYLATTSGSVGIGRQDPATNYMSQVASG